MGKRPAFQFYPADWRNDECLQACSLAARGLWIEMMCLMHNGTPYGHLTRTLNGVLTPILPDTLRRLVRHGIMEEPEIEALLKELEDNGVFSRDRDGTIFCRRMVADEELRQVRAEGGVKSIEHPNTPKPRRVGARVPTRVPSPPPLGGPPSSSSSSSSSNPSKPQADGVVRLTAYFDEQVWPIYPKRSGSNSRSKALAKFIGRARDGADPEVMRAGVERYARWAQVAGKVGTDYVMQGETFFGPGRHWEEPYDLPVAQKPTDFKSQREEVDREASERNRRWGIIQAYRATAEEGDDWWQIVSQRHLTAKARGDLTDLVNFAWELLPDGQRV